jgi:membrane associated rhomboid family serine protease
MDRASEGLRFEGSPKPGVGRSAAPTDRASAIALIREADELLEASETDHALALYARTTGFPDRDVAAAGLFGVANALYRLDRETEALEAWERVTTMGETPVLYRAWRQIAAARVRNQDLPGALEAYRQCERRAPASDKAMIASRLGWLSKETGNTRAAGRYFARSRGDALPSAMTYLIIAVTVVTSLIAMSGGRSVATGFGSVYIPSPLELQLQLDKIQVAHGELYRLLSVVLVHDPQDIFHLLFNMYALWYAGQLVERMYGARLMLSFYVATGVAASIASYVFGDSVAAVGASGAIFGLFGIVLIATRYHHAILDLQSRAIASQVLLLIVLNLVLGFAGVFGNVDNSAHLGGLVAGVWLALVMPPGRVPTLASFWQSPEGGRPPRLVAVGLPALGVSALIGVIVAGYFVGTGRWQNVSENPFLIGSVAAPAVPAAVGLAVLEQGPLAPAWPRL